MRRESNSSSRWRRLVHLVSGGVLILDDYGHYQGQRSAVDDYLNTTREPILLNRIDYSCRLGVKR